jgi:hypothetical protein
MMLKLDHLLAAEFSLIKRIDHVAGDDSHIRGETP